MSTSCSDANRCSICLSAVKPKTRSVISTCLHEFCFSCIKEWSEENAVCPLCKQNFTEVLHNIRSDADYDIYKMTRPIRRAMMRLNRRDHGETSSQAAVANFRNHPQTNASTQLTYSTPVVPVTHPSRMILPASSINTFRNNQQTNASTFIPHLGVINPTSVSLTQSTHLTYSIPILSVTLPTRLTLTAPSTNSFRNNPRTNASSFIPHPREINQLSDSLTQSTHLTYLIPVVPMIIPTGLSLPAPSMSLSLRYNPQTNASSFIPHPGVINPLSDSLTQSTPLTYSIPVVPIKHRLCK